MNVSVEFDITNNRLWIGSLSLPFAPADEVFAGALRIGDPGGETLLRPLTFGERFEIAGRAAKAAAPVDALCQWVLRASCIEQAETSSVDDRALEMAALVLAGGHEAGPSFAKSLTLLGEAGGWNLDQIEKTSCLIVDRVMQAIEPAEADNGWTRLDFNRGASRSIDDERRRLAENLLERVVQVSDSLTTPEQQVDIRASSYASESTKIPGPASLSVEKTPEGGNENGHAPAMLPDAGTSEPGADLGHRPGQSIGPSSIQRAGNAGWSSKDMPVQDASGPNHFSDEMNGQRAISSRRAAGEAFVSPPHFGGEPAVHKSLFDFSPEPIPSEQGSLNERSVAYSRTPIAPFDFPLDSTAASLPLPRGNEPFENWAPSWDRRRQAQTPDNVSEVSMPAVRGMDLDDIAWQLARSLHEEADLRGIDR